MTNGKALASFLLVAGAVGGYVLAVAYPRQHGQAHSCPAGAPTSSCFFPADLHAQRVAWSVAGGICALLLVGLIVGAVSLRHAMRGE